MGGSDEPSLNGDGKDLADSGENSGGGAGEDWVKEPECLGVEAP